VKWAFVGDLQIPYQDDRAVALWFKVMKWWKPDAIDILGDIDDQLEYSRFSDGTTDEFFSQLKKSKQEEGESDSDFAKRINPLPWVEKNALGAKEFYTDVAKAHPNADKHASLGNHDIRVFQYIDKKAPDYVDQVTPNFLWGLDDLGYTHRMYELPPLKRFANVHVHHGATVSDTGLAVRGDIEKYNISMARGHDHRGGVVHKSYPIAEQTLIGLGAGHLCDPTKYGLRYTINPQWEQGFGIAHVHGDDVHMQFINIKRDYTCVVDGRRFVG